jgi:hypothetical protein
MIAKQLRDLNEEVINANARLQRSRLAMDIAQADLDAASRTPRRSSTPIATRYPRAR